VDGEPILEQVRRTMGDLTPAEKRVGRVLLGQYPIAGLESMPTLAERAGVSAPTVIRFVSKLGYPGYGDFQRALRDEVQARMASPLNQYEAAGAPSDAASLAQRSLHIFETALRQTFAALPEVELRAATQLLADPRRRVLTVGGRFSGVLARYLYAHLYHLRSGAALVEAGTRPLVDALLDIGRRDAVVVFDYRRYQADVVAFARGAADRQAEVILFTDPWLSPASEVASVVLTARVDAPSPYDSLLGPLALVETLVAALAHEFGETGRRRVETLEALRGR
jgi:DNA-binding MurR/RpiR family transcriptional regulator